MFSLSCQGPQWCFPKCKLSKATGSLANLHQTSILTFGGNLSHILLVFACFGFFLLINSLLESGYSAFVTMWNTFAMKG